MSTADLVTLSIFVLFGLVSWRFRLSYQLSIVLGLFCLVVVAAFVAVGSEDLGDSVSVLAFYFLAVGVALAFLQKDAVPLRDTLSRLERILVRRRPRNPTKHEADPPV